MSIYLTFSNQGKTFKNAGWDFSISGSQSTGTVKNVVKPPQFRERKLDALYNQPSSGRLSESGNQGLSSSKNALEDSFGKDSRDHETNYDDVSLSNVAKLLPCNFELINWSKPYQV